MTTTQPALRGRALGEAVLDLVEAHPDLHDQTNSTCGTTACLAGWTVALHTGLQPGQDLSEGRNAAAFTAAWTGPRCLTTDLRAVELLFGGHHVDDERGLSDLGCQFDDEVWGNMSEPDAIAAYRRLVTQHAV
jgi:hypothetical protein